MEELDNPPDVEELSKAIDSLTCGKAPSKDGIPPEIIKAGKTTVLLRHLHELLCQCCDEGIVPQDMRDSNIVTLYKNKGDRRDCNNYRGISLLSIIGKAFARVVLNRLQTLAAQVYPESQCGFRAGRSTIDMIFSQSTARESSRTETTTVHCIHRPDQSLRPSQQEGAVHTAPEDRLSTKAPEDEHVLPREHARHGPVRRIILGGVPDQQWSQAGMCARNAVRHLLLYAARSRLQLVECSSIREATASCSTLKVRRVLIRDAIRRRRCSGDTQ